MCIRDRIYFVVHTLGALVTRNLSKLEDYLIEKKSFLGSNESEAKALHKLQVVFKNEDKNLTAKTNSIKVTLMQSPMPKEVFKFPAKAVIRKHLKEYVSAFEANCKEVTALNTEGDREETALLLRVVWAVAQIEPLGKDF